MPVFVEMTCVVCGKGKTQSTNPKTSVFKYCSTVCQQIKQMLEAVQAGKASARTLKRYLIYTEGRNCNKCKTKEWNGLPIPLELEHIDGNSLNNDLDNLKLLCPNCHAQTPTYKGANRGNGRHARRQRYAEGKSF